MVSFVPRSRSARRVHGPRTAAGRGLTVVADGTVATNLAVGQASGYVEDGLSGDRPFNYIYEGLPNLFDNSTGTKMFRTTNVALNPAAESTGTVIYLH